MAVSRILSRASSFGSRNLTTVATTTTTSTTTTTLASSSTTSFSAVELLELKKFDESLELDTSITKLNSSVVELYNSVEELDNKVETMESLQKEINDELSKYLRETITKNIEPETPMMEDEKSTMDWIIVLAAALVCLYFFNKAVNKIYKMSVSFIEFGTRHPRDYNGWRSRFWIATEMVLRRVWVPLWFSHERIWYQVIGENLDLEYQVLRRRNMIEMGNPINLARIQERRDRDDDENGNDNNGQLGGAVPVAIVNEDNNNEDNVNNGNNRDGDNGSDSVLRCENPFRSEQRTFRVTNPFLSDDRRGDVTGCSFPIYHDVPHGREMGRISPSRIPR